MNMKLTGVEATVDEVKAEPSEDALRAFRAAAETEYRFAKHVDDDMLVFSSQALIEVAPTIWRVETYVGVPA